MVTELLGITDLFCAIIDKAGYILDDNGWNWIRFTRAIRRLDDALPVAASIEADVTDVVEIPTSSVSGNVAVAAGRRLQTPRALSCPPLPHRLETSASKTLSPASTRGETPPLRCRHRQSLPPHPCRRWRFARRRLLKLPTNISA